ncbi:hypothetical protein [Aeromicrobium sp. 179-A 4D2 NHS]|uniref:hypothetical protein n=1 Tax=Aeromicrobium sp. 179-A 4D2 NHS TaxID=3142375 RepID=UPI0039A09196
MARNKKPKKAPPGGDPLNWVHEQQVDAPRADMPGTKKLTKSVKFHRRFIKAAIFILPVALLSNIVLVANSLGETEDTTGYTGPPASHTTATVAVKKWLSTDPSPLPGGEIISWDEYKKTPLPKGEAAKSITESGVKSVEVHSFTVASEQGVQYQVQVQLAVGDGTSAATVIGEPSLGPIAPALESIGTELSPWPTLPTGAAPDEVDTAVKVWAKAFSSGDPALLLNTVGDSRKGVSYVPLNGMILDEESTSIVHVGEKWGENQNPNEDEAPEQLLVQVEFEGYWPGTTTSTNQTSLPKVTYDLLVDRADTASPRVVAWAGPGGGYWLKPYSNAVTGVVVSADDLPDATNPDTESDTADPVEDEEGDL